jgi:hypothetical protein
MILPLLSKQILPISLNKENYPEKARDYRYDVFVIGWAIAVLFHMAHSRFFANGLHYTMLTIATALVLAKPSSLIRFMVFLGLQLTASFRVLPFVSNHEIFVMFVDFTIIHVTLFQIFRKRSFDLNKGELFDTFAPLVRIELLIFYFFVVFHKLNSSFFNPDLSCATLFYDEQNSFGLLPRNNFILLLNAYLTIFVEALIPILLCFRKTRNWGILIGLLFHCVIAFNPINGFFDISAAIFASYVVFTSRHFATTAYQTISSARNYVRKALTVNFSVQRVLLISITITLLCFAVYVTSKVVDDHFRFIFWTMFSAVVLYLFLKSYASERKSVAEPLSYKAVHYSLLLFPIIVFLNGICPYLGLKTESSYAMFSNLRTEGGKTNHYLVPASIQIFDYQKDLVEITSSSDRNLEKMAERNMVIPYFQFREIVASRRPVTVKYIRAGKTHTFELNKALPNNELLTPHPFLLKKFLRFRAISKFDPQPCSH